MRHTVLWGLLLVCLLVGHTHDEIDRLFSRIKVALAGHDYFTVTEMLDKIIAGLPGFELYTGHLSHVWAWKDLEALGSLLPLVLASAFIQWDGILLTIQQRNTNPAIAIAFPHTLPRARPSKKRDASDLRSLSRPQRSVMIHSLYGAGAWSA